MASLWLLAAPAWLSAQTPASREVSGDPVMKGPTGLPEAAVSRVQGTIRALLTTHPATGAGSCQLVRIAGAWVKGGASTPADLRYEKFLGPLTMKSLDQVVQSTATLHKGWPRGGQLHLAFSETPAPVELGACTLAESLLLDSMLRDWDIEPNLAVIGSVRPDGTVEAVEAIPDRLYAAARSRVGRIIVPAANEGQVADFLLSQGIVAFVGTQIFTAATFNDAGPLVTAQLSGETKEMMELFGAVQRTLSASGVNSVGLLRNERVQGTLKQVLEKAPNHLSAKVLYEWGTGTRAVMSLDGSADFIERGAAELIRGMRAKGDAALAIPRPELSDEIARLRFVRERLDEKARPYAESLLKFGESVQRAVGSSQRPPARLSGMAQKDYDAARQQAMDAWSKMAQARAGLKAP